MSDKSYLRQLCHSVHDILGYQRVLYAFSFLGLLSPIFLKTKIKRAPLRRKTCVKGGSSYLDIPPQKKKKKKLYLQFIGLRHDFLLLYTIAMTIQNLK